jgi:MFS family permease
VLSDIETQAPAGRRAVLALGIALFAVAYGTNVSTPLLLIYDREMGLSTLTVAALFAVYPLGLAPALIYSGPASDVLGRRPIVVPGLVLSAVASIIMILGHDSVPLLFIGRFLLGAVSGLVFVVASAWMRELISDRPLWAARMTGLVLYIGFGMGPLVAGALGEWVRWPLTLPYLVHIALVILGGLVIAKAPETVTRSQERKIRPNLGIPTGARRTFIRVIAPTALCVFGFPSLALGLFPVLLRPAMGSVAIFVTGVIGMLAMFAIIPAQALVVRWGPVRAAPMGATSGTIGCAIGTAAFATGAWPLFLSPRSSWAGPQGCV